MRIGRARSTSNGISKLRRELERVLTRKIELPAETIQEIIAFLEQQTVQPTPKAVSPIPVRDEDDQWVLASALAATAEVLVTGDKDLLDIAAKVTGLTITDPRGFCGETGSLLDLAPLP